MTAQDMSHRDRLLTEMGLGPVWKLRQPSAATSIPDAPHVPELMPAAPNLAQPAATTATPSVAEPGASSAAPSAAPPRAHSPRAEQAPVVQSPATDQPPAANRGIVPDRPHPIALLDWDGLHRQVSQCTACGLARQRTQTVFGVGDRGAEWLLVGEAPGAEEDRQGEPFVGQAGKLLDAMLRAIGLDRQHKVYIANVLKCRPPQNRNPEPDEIRCCTPYLHRQIELLQPKIIVAMGRFAASTLLGTEASLGSLRGQAHQFAGIPVVVTYHPAYLLRNMQDKAKAWQDLCLARSIHQQDEA